MDSHSLGINIAAKNYDKDGGWNSFFQLLLCNFFKDAFER